MKKIFLFIFLIVTNNFSIETNAFDSISVLPVGILSPSFQYGQVSGLETKFNNSGQLMMMEDMRVIQLDVKALKSIEPQVDAFVNALNSFGSSRLGDQIHMGYLMPHILPSVKYFAPIFAGGVTEKWTLGVGIPIVTYSNELSFTHQGSNVEQIHSQLRGVSADIENAFSRFNTDIVAGAQKHLVDLGYKPIENRRETFLGDIRLVSLYQFLKNQKGGGLIKTSFYLPTGPKDDPNDLTDISIFGQTAILNEIIGNYFLTSNLVLSAKFGLKNVLPDKISKRIPVDRNDELPGPNRLSTVQRDIGDTKLMGIGAAYSLSKSVKISSSLEHSNKNRDSYAGSLKGDYESLSADTESTEKRVSYGVEFSTVDSYQTGHSVIPMLVNIGYSDLFEGVNVIRQTQTEFSATMFF